jgi:hypothetical protein
MEKHWLIGNVLFLTFTVAVFWREILTVDVKVKKIILKSFMYCLKLGFFRLIFGLPLPSGLFIWRFVVGFLYLCCLLGPPSFNVWNKVNIEAS